MQQKKLFTFSLILNVILLIGLVLFIMRFHERIRKVLFPHSDADIVMFGDSITEYGDWSELFPDKNILNSGTAGTTTTNFLWDLDNGVLKHHPKICFVLGGTNDINQGIPATRTIENIRQIVQELQAHHIIPVLQSTLYTHSDKEQNALTDSINILITKLAIEKNIDHIDLNAILSSNGYLKREYTHDGVHLSENAYPLWAEKVKSVLAKYNL